MSSRSARGHGGRRRPALARSIETETEQPSISAKTAAPLCKTPIRPSPSTLSTSSSTSSSASSRSAASIFDQLATPPERSTSPITPPEDQLGDSTSPHYPTRAKLDFQKCHPYFETLADTDDCPEVEESTREQWEKAAARSSKHESDPDLPKLCVGRPRRVSDLKSQEQDRLSCDSPSIRKGRRTTTTRASSAPEAPPTAQRSSKRRLRLPLPIDDPEYLLGPSFLEINNSERAVSEEDISSGPGKSDTEKGRSLSEQDLPGQHLQDDLPTSDSEQPNMKTDSSSGVQAETDPKIPDPEPAPSKSPASRVPVDVHVASRARGRKKPNDTKVEKQRPVFKPLNKEMTALDINESIHKCIGKKAKPEKTENCGWIYVYTHTSECGKQHVKIGRTDTSVTDRLKRWKACNLPIEEQQDSRTDAFDHHKIVETLVSLELSNERREIQCERCTPKKRLKAAPKATRAKPALAMEDGGVSAQLNGQVQLPAERQNSNSEISNTAKTHHNEWYDIELGKANQSISRWRTWIIVHKPFDKQGNLTPYWTWKHNRAKRSLSTQDWDAWTQPPPEEYYFYMLECYYLKALAYCTSHKESFWLRVVIVALFFYICKGLLQAIIGILIVLYISS